MTHADFVSHIGSFIKGALKLQMVKNVDYAQPGGGVDDALVSFKIVGQKAGITPEQVWLAYFSKHVLSVEKYIRTGRAESEPIEERLKDLFNYILLLGALIQEKKAAEVEAARAPGISNDTPQTVTPIVPFPEPVIVPLDAPLSHLDDPISQIFR